MTDNGSADPLTIGFVTCRYPPMTSSGTFRVEAMMANFPRLGVTPTVVTIPDDWVHAQTNTLEGEVEPSAGVLRPITWSDPIVRGLSRVPVIRRGLREALIPDILAVWARSAADRVLPELRDVDLIYATSPPFSAMILADRLARSLGVPLVQEFRDPPSFNRRLRGRSRLTHRRMAAFERRYLAAADATIAVTEGTRRELLARHSDLDPDRMHVVTNGYPDIDADPTLARRDPAQFTVSYIGSFQGSQRRGAPSRFTPEIIIPALRALPQPARLRIVGPVTAAQQQSLRNAGGDLVEFVGRVPRHVAIAELAASDVCLALAEDDPWWIGRKIFEYMAFAQRILAVVPPGDTADLLAESPHATLVNVDDDDGLIAAVAALYESWMAGETAPGERPRIQTDATCAEGVVEVLRSVV